MARSGETIENPVTGETVVWHETTADTGGRRLRLEIILRPGGAVPEHVHRISEERFEVLAGSLSITIDGEERSLGPGEDSVVHAGSAHSWRNDGAADLRVMVELEPAGTFEAMMEGVFALARGGRVHSNGVPYLLDAAVLFDRVGLDTYATKPPLRLQRLVIPPLAMLGRRLGRGRTAGWR